MTSLLFHSGSMAALTISSKDFDGLKLHIRGTKTQNADRKIKITPQLKELIYSEEGLIFNYKENFVTKKFKDYITDLNLSGTLHSLRYSYATNQYYIGTPAKEVQLLMVHSEIGITLNIYTNIEIEQNKNKIIEKIKDVYNNYYIQLQDRPLF